MTEPRFYLDHGMIHDRATGKHVTSNGEWPYEDTPEMVCELLNGVEARAEAAEAENTALREAGRALVAALQDTVESLEQTLYWRGEGWECSEDELLGEARAALALRALVEGEGK